MNEELLKYIHEQIDVWLLAPQMVTFQNLITIRAMCVLTDNLEYWKHALNTHEIRSDMLARPTTSSMLERLKNGG